MFGQSQLQEAATSGQDAVGLSGQDSDVVLTVRDLRAGYGSVEAVRSISFAVERGEFITLLGPSGCGKTTTLRCVAGLETPWSGEIVIDGRTVSSSSVNIPTEKRDVNMVFQSYAVWPHLAVLDNVSYGLRNKGLTKQEIRDRAMEALELVGLADFKERYGTELSGGQQQRIAVARAIVTRPRILLFDEPLSNLDAGLRERMRDELLELHRIVGGTALYVTHDQSEAMAMSDRIVLMNEGRVEQLAAPEELYQHPATTFAASFIGTTNLFAGRYEADGHSIRFVADEGSIAFEAPDVGDLPNDARGRVSIRPEKLMVGDWAADATHSWEGEITNRVYLGSRCDLSIAAAGVIWRADVPGDFSGQIGDAIAVGVLQRDLRFFSD